MRCAYGDDMQPLVDEIHGYAVMIYQTCGLDKKIRQAKPCRIFWRRRQYYSRTLVVSSRAKPRERLDLYRCDLSTTPKKRQVQDLSFFGAEDEIRTRATS